MPLHDYGVGIQLNDDTLVLKGLDKVRKPETPTNLETPFFEDHQIFEPIPPQPKSNKNDSNVTFSATLTPKLGHASQSAESIISSISVGTMNRLRKGSGNAKKPKSLGISINDENTSEKMFDPEIMHRNMVVGDYSSTFLVPKPVTRRKTDKNTWWFFKCQI